MTTRRWQDGAVVDEDFPLDDVSEHLARDGSLVWVDLCEPDHTELLALARELEPRSTRGGGRHRHR